MTTHSTHAHTADVHAHEHLCHSCRIADGRPHLHLRDHLGHDGLDQCTCPDHVTEALCSTLAATTPGAKNSPRDRHSGPVQERAPPLAA